MIWLLLLAALVVVAPLFARTRDRGRQHWLPQLASYLVVVLSVASAVLRFALLILLLLASFGRLVLWRDVRRW
jgi:hypothetical protein